jgi:hypothetical protein
VPGGDNFPATATSTSTTAVSGPGGAFPAGGGILPTTAACFDRVKSHANRKLPREAMSLAMEVC